MSMLVNEALKHADYLIELSDDWRAEHNGLTANDLDAASRTVRQLAGELVEHEAKPDPIDMLAVWEYYMDGGGDLEMLPSEGYAAHRQYVVDHLTAFCDHWWAYCAVFLSYCDSFDWEFLPVFLGALPTHDVSALTQEQIWSAVAAVYEADSFRIHAAKQEANP